MVSDETNERKTIEAISTGKEPLSTGQKAIVPPPKTNPLKIRTRRLLESRLLMFGTLALFAGVITFLIIFAVNIPNLNRLDGVSDDETSAYQDSDNSESEDADEPEEPEPETPEIAKINLQPTVDVWVNSVSGKKGVIIYDLDRDEVVGEYNADTKMQTASLYKLFVVYEGYRRVQNGTWNGNQIIINGNTILKCLDLSVRESNSDCAETLWGMIGRDNLNQVVQEDFGLKDFYVNNLTATPREIMKMLKIFYEHAEITDANLIAQMKDSFLNQPVTVYDWRQGLPRGFSSEVLVYNKVGWSYMIDAEDENGKVTKGHWDIYDDAAILDFTKQNRHLIVVVMTSGVDYKQIRDFGAKLEQAMTSYQL